jgi:hypothetical protein
MHRLDASFIPGLDLSEAFYREAVEPIIRKEFPDLAYAAALIGSGSEVLGLDTEMSTDHHWGPRVMLFLNDGDVSLFKAPLTKVLSEKLPRRFRGYPTSYVASAAADDQEKGIQMLDYCEQGPINHRVSISSIRDFVMEYLGFDVSNEISPIDWLTFPDQKLLSITGGRVFHDNVGLNELRRKFAYYPHDVWLYLLAAQWTRIEQEEHLMGRAGSVGDEIGSAIIASRLVRDLMRLCFLMEKTYAPYPKWFGTAFRNLKAAATLEPILLQVLTANDWKQREKHLIAAYECVAHRHNELAVTGPMPVNAAQFHGRPYWVISMGAFSKALSEMITDPEVVALAKKPLIGSIDQLSDSTDLQADPLWRDALCGLYESKRDGH